MKDLLKQIGQLFIIGFPGAEPPRPFLDFVAEEQIGGVILFEENCPSHDAVKVTVARIKGRYRGIAPFIAIDQEGGRVVRLRGAPAEFRHASEYGAEGTTEHFREEYRRAAVFMESIGINLNLAPVCDLLLEKHNTCLIGRCFGDNPQEVSRFVEASVRMSRASGLLSCLKHFPGLGASRIDPHQQTATVDYDELIWEQRERIPFAAGVAAGADMVMTTHVRLEGYDDVIATASEKIIRSLLRQRLAFDGPVITDDLTMLGADELGDIGPRTVAAFNAGHDILLFGRDYEQAERAFDYFNEAVRRGEITTARLRAALERVSGVKFKLDSTVLP